MSAALKIVNNGPEIIETNYFESDYARRGAFYLSINAGVFRLLVPTINEPAISEFQTAREIIISRGPWPAQERTEAIELLFDDHTDNPYSIHMGIEQIDRLPPSQDAGKPWQFSAWVTGPECVYRAQCHYRIVKALPYLKPWNK